MKITLFKKWIEKYLNSDEYKPNIPPKMKFPNINKTIPPVDDKYITWTGKDEGKPKPPIVWINNNENNNEKIK